VSRNRLKSTDGVAALEFGLVLPLLIVILTGIVDYGHAYFVRLSMSNAAREGARIGATLPAADAASVAKTTTEAYLARSGIDATVTVSTPSQAEPTVDVEITLAPFEPLVGLVPVPDHLHASAAMRWELPSPEP